MDEATASVKHLLLLSVRLAYWRWLQVDFETDTLVQKAIKQLKDVTILTIAHRLVGFRQSAYPGLSLLKRFVSPLQDTIIEYDRILVLDAGKKVEFDSPANLLKNPDSFFRRLVENSGHKEQLFALGSAKS